jgi:hypothetical protein
LFCSHRRCSLLEVSVASFLPPQFFVSVNNKHLIVTSCWSSLFIDKCYFVDNISLQPLSVSLIHLIFLLTNNHVPILQSADVSIP